MDTNNDLTAEFVRQILDYNPDTGVLRWKERPASMFKDGEHSASHRAALWNSRYVGTVAGKLERWGYRDVCINHRHYKAHRLAWLIMTGEWPKDQIDHINLNKNDNRWPNLRAATHSENMANRRLHRNNMSGCKGVYWHKRQKKWLVEISKDKRKIYLGCFDMLEDAERVRKEAAEHFHGKYARGA